MRGPYKRAALYERVNALFGPISVLFITKTFLLEFFPGVYFCDLHRNGITKAMMGMGRSDGMERSRCVWRAATCCTLRVAVNNATARALCRAAAMPLT